MKKSNSSPPAWASRMMRIFCPPHLSEELIGDLHEQFDLDIQRVGNRRAKWRYIMEVAKFAKPYFLKRRLEGVSKTYSRQIAERRSCRRQINNNPKPLILSPDMIINYLKVARRNLVRHKSYTTINIAGLTLGMVCAILIFSFVNYHLSFDRFHTKANRIYRITTELHDEKISKYGTVPAPLGNAVRQDYSFIEKSGRIITFGGVVSLPASEQNVKFNEPNGVAYTEPSFFEIMDFPLASGDRKTMLTEPNTAIITEKLALKYFHSASPIGKIFRLDNKTDFTITGILKELPVNTDIRQEIFLSYSTISQTNKWLDTWGGIYSGSYCYVLLKPGVVPNTAEKALAGLSTKYYNAKDAKIFRYRLQPLSDVHFNQELGGNIAKNQLIALSLIGIFLIITACVNFINLATAQALGRSKEIGIRKALGSIKGQLFWQFITETTVITVLAFVLAIVLAYLALPYMNNILQTRVTLDLFRNINHAVFLMVLLTAVIFISGSYPGLILSGFQPISALKGKLNKEQSGSFSIRKGLVVTQFAISQTLLIGTIVVASQMKFNSQTTMGFDKESIVMLPVPDTKPAKTSAMTARFSQLPGVEKITYCNAPPASYQNVFDTGIQYANRTEAEKFNIFFRAGDINYLSTFGLTLVAGRNLAQSDTIREYLLNETAVKKLGVKSVQEVIGKNVSINNRSGIIVGVMKDFHNGSFRSKIDPLCLTTHSGNYFTCALKITGENLPATLASLEKIWNETNPENIYSYQFLDEHVAGFYANDNLILQLMWFFAGIAIFIGCLGLYGLISFMAAQKTKEIGVRKTLGADIVSIIWLFGKQFAQLLIIAFIIATPVAWWAMDKYLSDFQYHIKLGAGIFLIAIGATFVIAVLTVGYRSVRAALMNPVKALRSE